MSLAETELRYYAPLGNASALSRTERGIVLNVGEERFRAEFVRADVLKLAISQAGRFDEAPTFAVSATLGEPPRFDPYYTSIPFFYHARLAADGDAKLAGFFIDNGYKASFDFSERERYRYLFHGGQYTEYVFAGPELPSILEQYTALTGRMQPPPLWSLGHHQCRWKDYSQEEFSEIGREYRRRNLPCDSLWLDIGYMDGYRVYTWHKERFPDVPKMMKAAEADGFKVITIVDPGVKLDPGYSVFEEGRAKGVFCKTETGKLYVGQVWPGRTVFPDFTQEKARNFWADLTAKHLGQGLAGIWNDMNEPATGEVEPFSMRFDRDGQNHSHERFHNQYGLLMAMSTVEGFNRHDPNARPFILSRAGFAGIQRYAAQWLGDNYSDWEHLAMGIPMALGLGLSGQPFIGADIPGFAGTPNPEMAVRWFQYGTLTPFSRCHAIMGEPDQYPWSFGASVEKIVRESLELRYKLLPYLYSKFWESHETGAPIQRPLLFDFQHDPTARDTDDTFLLGDALLVAPVTEPGKVARTVYLPRGTWYDWHTGEAHAGEHYITAAAPLERIPLFARGGSIIACHSRALRSTGEHHATDLELHLFVPAEDGEFRSTLHEDDGRTKAHAKGAYLRTTFTTIRKGNELRVRASVTGQGYPEHQRKSLTVVVHGSSPNEIERDGHKHAVSQRRITFDNRGEGFELVLKL